MNHNGGIDLHYVLNQITDSVIIVDLEGRIHYYNGVAQSYREIFPEGFDLGVLIYDLVPRETAQMIRNIMQTAVTERTPQFAQFSLVHPAGHTLFFDVSYTPIVDGNKALHQVCIVSRDVTVKKSLEKRNKQLMSDFSTLIEKANAVIFSIDSQGYVTEWNGEAERVSGQRREDVLGTKPGFFLSDDNLAFALTCEKILRGTSVTNGQLFLRNNGKLVVVLINGTPKVNAEGKVIGALFIGQDVTELMEYRRSLERQVQDRTQKLKEALEKEKELVEIKNKFVSIVSHEFKLPLSAIGNSVDVLRKTAPAHSTQLESITQHVNVMRSLLEDILHIDRQETVKLKPKVKQVDFKKFLDGIIGEVVMATGETHKVVTEMPEYSLLIESDEKLLRNIFINLVSNAIKFSPGQREVRVTVLAREGTLWAFVTDFGVGIEKSDLDKLFQPFSRGTNVKNIAGTGLGLSIVKRAVVALKGKISVDSRPGVGTTFTVEIPLQQAE